MACPYFMPTARLENGTWPHPARLPLGAGWAGHCAAPGHEGEMPTQDVLEAFCNLGYASGCAWAPKDRSCDAVRFAVLAPGRTAKERDARSCVVRLRYVCERNHRPVSDGELEFDRARACWIKPHDNPGVQKMAECFLESYLRRTDSREA